MPPDAAPNVLTKTASNCFPTLQIFPWLLTTTQTLPGVFRLIALRDPVIIQNYSLQPAHCRVIKTFIRHQTLYIIPGAALLLTPVRDVNNKTE